MLKIITAYNNKYKPLIDISFPIIENYCNYHCYAFEAYKISENYPRPASWAKIQYLLTNLEENTYHYVLWIDADAIINNSRYDLLSVIDPSKYIYLSKDFNSINCGVILLKNNFYNKQLLSNIWNSTQYLHHHWWEQAALIDIIDNNLNDIQTYIKYIPSIEFHAYTSDITDLIDYQVNNNTFILHLPSLPIELRQFRFKQIEAKYKSIYRSKFNVVAFQHYSEFISSWSKMKQLSIEQGDFHRIELCDIMLFRFLQNLYL